MVIWIAWFFLASVPLYVVSESARIEVTRSMHPIESSVSGRIAETAIAVSREVQSGDVLVTLDSTIEESHLTEERARLNSFVPQLDHLRLQLAAENQNRVASIESAGHTLEALRERYAEAEATVSLSIQESNRAEELFTRGMLPELELIRVRAQSEKHRAAAAAIQAALEQQEPEQRIRLGDHEVRAVRLARDIADLEGQIAAARAKVTRLEHELGERQIRAPISGRIGEIADLRIGSIVRAGDRLGAIIPSGSMAVVAWFTPSIAVGRVAAGQTANVRFDAFPHLEFGTVPAKVVIVASEARDGLIRVELAPALNPPSRIPLQHGMTGVVEVETGRVTPAAIVLRGTSRFLAVAAEPAPRRSR